VSKVDEVLDQELSRLRVTKSMKLAVHAAAKESLVTPAQWIRQAIKARLDREKVPRDRR
jgi:hypothetical protein